MIDTIFEIFVAIVYKINKVFKRYQCKDFTSERENIGSNLHGLLEKGFENDNVGFTGFQLHYRLMHIYKKFSEITTYLQLCIFVLLSA